MVLGLRMGICGVFGYVLIWLIWLFGIGDCALWVVCVFVVCGGLWLVGSLVGFGCCLDLRFWFVCTVFRAVLVAGLWWLVWWVSISCCVCCVG